MAEDSKPTGIASGDLKPQLIKLALELGPLVIFFLANARGEAILAAFPALKQWFPQPILFATAVFMVTMVIALILSKAIMKRIAIMPLVTGVVVLIFGGLTLYLQDDTFIKMKPTIVNLLFGGVLLGGLPFGQSLLKYVFGEVYKLREEGWTVLTLRWGLFFLALAILNEIIWRNFSTDMWVTFKVWGIMPLTIVFSMLQLPALSKYAVDEEQD
jgi:intracellular septation protein